MSTDADIGQYAGWPLRPGLRWRSEGAPPQDSTSEGCESERPEAFTARSVSLPATVVGALRNGAEVSDGGVPRLLVAAVAELLRRQAGDAEVALLVEGVDHPPLPLRLEVDPDGSWETAVRHVGVAAERAPDVAVIDQAARCAGFAVHVGATTASPTAPVARLQVTLVVEANAPSLVVAAPARWLDADAVAHFAHRLVALLESAAADPQAAIGDVNLVTAAERELLEGAWAGTRMPYPAEQSAASRFREVVARQPGAIAVEDASGTLSYADLVACAVRLGADLRHTGVPPHGRVGVLVERGIAQVVALASVFEAGCAYVPLDGAQPVHRLRTIAAEAELDAIIADAAHAALAASLGEGLARPLPIVVLTSDHARPESSFVTRLPALRPEAADGGDTPAYVLFTSGSTGTPKGVEVPHRGLMRLACGTTMLPLGPGDRMLGFAPITFDVSVFEIWGALLNGATLVLAPAGPLSLGDLAAYIASRGVTAITIATALFAELVEFHADRLAGVRQISVGGEAMPARAAQRLLALAPALRLVNGYGPTENAMVTTAHVVERGAPVDAPVPIGRPVENTTVYLLDRRGRLVEPGAVGELCTGGDGLALGYVGRPELTAERFVMYEHASGRLERVYRTGDLARHRSDGVLEFLGRADGQVKLRGYRIELDEIEHVLRAAPGVAGAALAVVGEAQARRLRAAVVLSARGGDEVLDELAAHARARLPAWMVPSEFVVVPRIPTTPHGKIDRKAIGAMPMARASSPVPENSAPAGGSPAGPSARDVERAISEVWASLLGVDAVPRDVPFFDMGGNSLLALRLVEALRQGLSMDVPIVRVFEHPTIAGLAAALTGAMVPARAPLRDRGHEPAREDRRIAIVGMAGRFPGAPTAASLWRLLRDECEGVRRFTRDELDPSVPDRDDPAYVPARGVLDDVESFDPAFFGLSPRVAEVMDPQQRVLLETAWQAFEDAGIVPGDGERLTGVFTGVSHDEYAERNLATRPELARQLGELAIVFGNDKDYSASHIAHRLDLRGPAVAVQTSSSTSLTAVALAVQALRAGQCDLALAGGASVSVPTQRGHRHEEGAMFSRDGHTRAFDADASGTVFSDGVAMLLLQRLEDAKRDGHRILGVISGVGMTNDGAMRASFSAPTVQGQAACITRALADAGWSAESVQYVEAHGTGTPLGDPIEVTALTRAFAAHTPRTRFCWLGSLKSNIGHLTAAAGAAGVIKVLLAMHHRWIPATLHVDRPNPRIDFANSPFLLPRAGVPWEAAGGARRAGVSSFGVGGTNVHVLLEAWDDAAEDLADDAPRGTGTRGETHATTRRPTLLQLSARTGSALRARAAQLADAIAAAESGGKTDALSLGAVASTLRHGRMSFARRATIVAGTLDQAVERLRAFAASPEPATDAPVTHPPAVVLLFPGQGTQTPGAARSLYEALPVFRDAIDRCASAAGLLQDHPLTTWLFADASTVPDVADRLRHTELAQPVLFALEYALGHTIMAAGITPVAMVGHSIGEFAAACLSGVLGVEDAMRVVVARGRLMGARPGGAMLAVRMPADALIERLATHALPGVSLAAINAPQLCVVAGDDDAIAACERMLVAAEVSCRRLQTSHAFHSPAMDEAARAFEQVMRDVTLHPPTIPFASCVTGALITPALATDPAYWARQLREPVRFADGLAAAVACAGDRECVGVEAGPRETLTTLARQSQRDRVRPVALLPLADGVDEREAFLTAVGALWERGVEGVTWDVIDPLPRERPVSLPGYPFDRRRCWIDPLPSKETHAAESGVDSLLEVQMQLLQDQLGILTRAMAASTVGAAVEQS